MRGEVSQNSTAGARIKRDACWRAALTIRPQPAILPAATTKSVIDARKSSELYH